MEFRLTAEDKETLELFNKKADEIVNSSFVKESRQKNIGFNISSQMNDETRNFDTTYDVVHHNKDFINSIVLPIRMFIQNNDRISICKMSLLYKRLPSIYDYKKTFDVVQNYLNSYLDEKARTFLDDQPSKRELLDTIIYGELAHLNREKSKKKTTEVEIR